MLMNPYVAEFIGTAIILLLGAGVNANVNLKNTLAEEEKSPWILITSAWGFAVFVAVFVTGESSGGHLNPAVTFGLAIAGKFSWSIVPFYIISQVLGAMFGSWLAYLTYIDHYRATNDEEAVRSTFCTGPAIRNIKNNLFSEAIGTFMLVFAALFIVGPNIEISGTEVQNFGIGSIDALPIGIVVWVIGIALGGTTGYAINPARDFGPRLIYQMLPRKNKNADWSYSWVPVFGPISGGAIAGLIYIVLLM